MPVSQAADQQTSQPLYTTVHTNTTVPSHLQRYTKMLLSRHTTPLGLTTQPRKQTCVLPIHRTTGPVAAWSITQQQQQTQTRRSTPAFGGSSALAAVSSSAAAAALPLPQQSQTTPGDQLLFRLCRSVLIGVAAAAAWSLAASISGLGSGSFASLTIASQPGASGLDWCLSIGLCMQRVATLD